MRPCPQTPPPLFPPPPPRTARAASSRRRSASAISVTPIDNRVELLILQHPQEQDRLLGIGAARGAAFQERACSRSACRGRRCRRSLGRETDPKRWAILYLGSREGRGAGARPRHRGGEPQGRGAARPGCGAARHRRHHPARRHLEPGQGDLVAQRLDAQVPPRAARAASGRRATASCAASRAATGFPPSRPPPC